MREWTYWRYPPDWSNHFLSSGTPYRPRNNRRCSRKQPPASGRGDIIVLLVDTDQLLSVLIRLVDRTGLSEMHPIVHEDRTSLEKEHDGSNRDCNWEENVVRASCLDEGLKKCLRSFCLNSHSTPRGHNNYAESPTPILAPDLFTWKFSSSCNKFL